MPIKDKNLLRAEVEQNIEDNENGRVSPEDIRSALLDIIDSNYQLSSDINLIAGNISSIEVGNTYVGEGSATKKDVDYNTSIGYFALRSNDAEKNTAVGAYASTCNVYGSGNTSLGYGALGGNFDGFGNTSLGKHSLLGNKNGNFNIGIGHGAGYYIDENDSYKFYLASHDVDESGMCNYPDGITGLSPLLYGDLLNGTLVIGSDLMHSDGALQVNGNVTPVSSSGEDNLGSYNYPWNRLYVKQLDSNSGVIESRRDFNPYQGSVFDLGSEDKPWRNGYFDNLTVNSSLDVTDLKYVTIEDSTFYDKQLHLASSGVDSNNNTLPYLTDEGIDGAGFSVKSSGTNYLRTYFWTYKAPDLDWDCLETENAYSRSAWLSNISVEIMDGRHLKTQRVMSPDTLSLTGRNCFGMFLDENVVIGTKGDRDSYNNEYYQPQFISYAGLDYARFTVSRGSGVFIEDNLLSQYDGTNDLVGFKRRYVDSDDSHFVISSHLNEQTPISQFVTMRDRASFGFTDQANFVPETLLNTKSSGEAIFRHTGEVSSRIQLSSPDNLFTSGVEIHYSNEDSRFGILTKEGDLIRHALTVSGDLFGINYVDPFATLTIGKDRNFNAAISLQEGSGQLKDKEGWGTVYVKATPEKDIPNSLFYRNEEGQDFDLLLSSGDKSAPDSVWYDEWRNTFVGQGSVGDRVARTSSDNLQYNTTLGDAALFDLVYGSGNVALGASAGSGIEFGSNNIFIGSNAGALEDDLGQTISNQFRLGHNDDDLLMSGKLPYGENRGYVYVQSDLGVVSKDGQDKFRMGQLGGDTIFSKESSGNIYFRYFDNHSTDPFIIEEEGIYTPRVRFSDGTYFDTSSGVKFAEGTAITFSPESGTDRRNIDVDIDKLDTTDDMYQDSYVMISSSGENFKSSILNIARFVNPDNPEMFFECGGGYNIVVSRNSDVDNSKNCNNLVGGFKGGHNIDGFTNSLILGSKAGENAKMQNPGLSIDTAAVFLGYNAGRKSSNADNSVFIGPSAGQHSVYCDNSIFIGNSAGESSASEKSIALGDNTLVGVDGENNLEIVADLRPNNRLINGVMSNKFNIQGVIAGDHCSGRVSVGGAARVYPHAVLEVAAGYGDTETRLQEWYNGNGQLVGYLDQDGNLVLNGIVVENNSYLGENNLEPADQLNPEVCGNTNSGGNVPIPGENTNDGGSNFNAESTSYSIALGSTSFAVGTSTTLTITRFGGTLGDLVFTITTSSGVSAPEFIIVPDGVASGVVSISGSVIGLQSVTTNSTTLGSKNIEMVVVDPSAVPPAFSVAPTISPSSANEGTTFTSTNGTITNGSISGRTWKLNNQIIAINTNSVTPESAGTLTFQVDAVNEHGSSTNTASATVVAVPTSSPVFTTQPSITPGTGQAPNQTYTGTNGVFDSGSVTNTVWKLDGIVIGNSNLTVTPTTGGTLTLEITVTNNVGSTTATASASVTAPPETPLTLTFAYSDETPQLGDTVTLTTTKSGGPAEDLTVWTEAYTNGSQYDGYEEWVADPQEWNGGDIIPNSTNTFTRSGGVPNAYFSSVRRRTADPNPVFSNWVTTWVPPKLWNIVNGNDGNNTQIAVDGNDIFLTPLLMIVGANPFLENTLNLSYTPETLGNNMYVVFQLPGFILSRADLILDIRSEDFTSSSNFNYEVFRTSSGFHEADVNKRNAKFLQEFGYHSYLTSTKTITGTDAEIIDVRNMASTSVQNSYLCVALQPSYSGQGYNLGSCTNNQPRLRIAL